MFGFLSRRDRPFDFEREQVFEGYNPTTEIKVYAPDLHAGCTCTIVPSNPHRDNAEPIIEFCDFCLTQLTAGEPLH